MMYLEMARDEEHGGGTWAFPNCVWAPTAKRGGGTWPFWEKIMQIKESDIILHLRGKTHDAHFVGYSVASTDGFITKRRPPTPKIWDHAESYYRADLRNFVVFHEPINLAKLFSARATELQEYFVSNKIRGRNKANIFFVRQSGRLQCLNGAYLSDIDEKLFVALFGKNDPNNFFLNNFDIVSVQTNSQISTIYSRIGQTRFSSEIKKLYGNRCCFPGCPVTDTRFLVGSHIARWSDNESLRGELGNGLCFCLVHDKAFEIGLFTIDEQYRVFVNPKEITSESTVIKDLVKQNGKQIKLAKILPLDDALLEHWTRVDIEP